MDGVLGGCWGTFLLNKVFETERDSGSSGPILQIWFNINSPLSVCNIWGGSHLNSSPPPCSKQELKMRLLKHSIYWAPLYLIRCSKYKNQNKMHDPKNLTVPCVYIIFLGCWGSSEEEAVQCLKRRFSCILKDGRCTHLYANKQGENLLGRESQGRSTGSPWQIIFQGLRAVGRNGRIYTESSRQGQRGFRDGGALAEVCRPVYRARHGPGLACSGGRAAAEEQGLEGKACSGGLALAFTGLSQQHFVGDDPPAWVSGSGATPQLRRNGREDLNKQPPEFESERNLNALTTHWSFALNFF